MFGPKNWQAFAVCCPETTYSKRCNLAGCVCLVGRLEKLTVVCIFQKIFYCYCKPKMSFCVDYSPCWPPCAAMIKRRSVSCSLQFTVDTLKAASHCHNLNCSPSKLRQSTSVLHVMESDGRRTKHRNLTLMLSFYFVCEQLRRAYFYVEVFLTFRHRASSI